MSRAEGVQTADALAALRADDLDSFSDWLHAVRFATAAAAGDALRSVAESIVAEGLRAGFAPTTTVDEITTILMGRCGIPVSPEGDDTDERGARSPRSLVESGPLDDASVRHELLAAYDEIARLRAERDTLEARVDELAGARVLADQLAAELERDEWIRARLRRVKATRPVRGVIYARRWLRSRTSSATSR
jgi:hypothetical protein